MKTITAKLTCIASNRYVNKEIVTFHAQEGSVSPFSRPGTENPLQLTFMNPDAIGKFVPGQDYELSFAPIATPKAD